MATIDLGKIAITPEGQWSYGKYYEKLSLVIFNGQSYLSLRDTTGDNPETSRSDWMQITSRGESLYQMMVREGKFVGTEEEFLQQYLDSLKACADASEEVRAALSDILDEMDRVRAEISEVMVEEDIRIKNEAKREAAEINRRNAEITRGVEERNRQEAEQRREQSMQQIQNDAEIALAMAAEAQQKAEEAILNEEERVKAENQRKIDEATRIQSEEQRVNDEAMRRSREADRQESENIRQKNEGDRILAEREREEIMRNLVEELKALAANRFKIVDVLPEVGEFAVIYLVPSTTPSDNDVYDEWAYVSEKWEHIGSTRFEMDNYFTKEEVEAALDTKANIQHQHTVADITDFPELYYDATAFFTSGAYPSDKYEELLEAVRAKRTVYATIDEEGHVSYVFFMSSANSDGSSSRVLLTTIFADGGYLYINTFVLQQSGMTPLQESITGKADKATTLAGYGIGDAYTKSEVDTALEGKQDTLTAGNGISIEGNVISSSVAEVVDNIVNAGYVFAGVATPATDPSTPNAKVFYIANGKGTYEKFGGIEVTEDEVVVLKYDTAWHKVATGIASNEKLTELGKVKRAISEVNTSNIALEDSYSYRPSSYDVGSTISSVKRTLSTVHNKVLIVGGDINVGDKVYIYGKGGNNDRLYFFINSNNILTMIAPAGQDSQAEPSVITIDEKGTLYINILLSSSVVKVIRESVGKLIEVGSKFNEVEQQLSDLKRVEDAVDNIVDSSTNINLPPYCPAELGSSGIANASSTAQTSRHILVSADKYYSITHSSNVYEYKRDGVFIGRTRREAGVRFQVSAETQYIRVNWEIKSGVIEVFEYTNETDDAIVHYTNNVTSSSFELPKLILPKSKSITMGIDKSFSVDIHFKPSASIFDYEGKLFRIKNEKNLIGLAVARGEIASTNFAVKHGTTIKTDNKFNSDWSSIPIVMNWWGRDLMKIRLKYPVIAEFGADGTPNITEYMPSTYEGMYVSNVDGVMRFHFADGTEAASFTLADYASISSLASAIEIALPYIEVDSIAKNSNPSIMETFERIDLTKLHEEYTLTTGAASGRTYYDAFPVLLKSSDMEEEHHLRLSVQLKDGYISVQFYMDGLVVYSNNYQLSAYGEGIVLSFGDFVGEILSSEIMEYQPMNQPLIEIIHGISDSDVDASDEMNISLSSLRERLELMRKNGFTFDHTLRDIISKIRGSKNDGNKEMCLTFDDRQIKSWRNPNIRMLLQKYGVKPTMYYIYFYENLASGQMPSGENYPSLDEVKAMLAAGWGFESHGTLGNSSVMSYAQTSHLFDLIQQRWVEWFGINTNIFNVHEGEYTIAQYNVIKDKGFFAQTSASAPLGVWQGAGSTLDAQIKRVNWIASEAVSYDKFLFDMKRYLKIFCRVIR